MLGRRFLQVDGQAVPNPVPGTFKIEFNPDETIETSEAGTELGSVKRLDKRTFSGTWQLTSFWLKQFEQFCKLRTVTLTYQGHDYTTRARGYNPQLAPDSEYTAGTDGLWTVNITFTEI